LRLACINSLLLGLLVLFISQNLLAIEQTERTSLSASWLLEKEHKTVKLKLLSLSAFVAKKPLKSLKSISLQGRIVFKPNSTNSKLFLTEENEVYKFEKRTRPNDFSVDRKILPTMAFDFVQSNNNIIPTNRYLTISKNRHWDYILGVGNIWQEQADLGFYRIAMPFALVEKNQNCVHNGVLSFLVNEDGHSSDFYYQISSETCIYFKADFWGTGSVSFQPKSVKIKTETIKRFQNEQQDNLSFEPIEKLKHLHPQLNLDKLALSSTINSSDMTRFGVIYQGVHYGSNCMTRAGDYPFCQQLVLPSYSTAKSLFSSLAMFTLAEQYPNIFDEKVVDWVQECSGKNWQNVTFSHLLNMSSGNYLSDGHSVDEGEEHSQIFFAASNHQEKITYSCQYFPHKKKPGQQFVYHSSDTYLLGSALNNFIKTKVTPDADVYNDILVAQLWSELSISEVMSATRRTTDNLQQPFTGYGLFLLADDMAKLSSFLVNQQKAKIKPKFRLNEKHLIATMKTISSATDMKTNYEFIHYQNGFWKQQITKLLHCTNDTWLPYMLGYGGISVVLASEELQYYYFSDSDQYIWRDAISELNKITPLCN